MTNSDVAKPDGESSPDAHERLERDKNDLLAHVGASDLSTMTHKCAWLLNHFPATRNSDITLQIAYWRTFEKEKVSGNYVALNDLYGLARLPTLARARAKIQNEYRLFLADPEIRERRGTLQASEREKATEARDYPVYAVFLDESGKTGQTLIVGSLWFLSSGSESIALHIAATKLKESSEFTGEFHFSTMRRDDLPVYKKLIDIFVLKGGTISFKFISLDRHGIRNIQTAVDDLYYNLIVRGINHEITTGRAPLPRILNIWKDLEEVGSDKLLMANLENKLRQDAASVYDNKLSVEKCIAIDSKTNVFLQVADLVAGSVNRILSRSGGTHNHKDELADYLVDCLGISTAPDLDIPIGDHVAHIKL